jgi:ATP-dependent helicase/nuclease subunit B
VRNAFAPASFTALWLDVPASERRADGITQVDCATPAEEALTIALAMREVLETPGKTAALVTPDRAIATRVAAHLKRWGVAADDSAGQPLVATKAGELALELAAVLADGFGPVELISLLSHPLVRADVPDSRRQWMDQVRELDLVLRGPRPASGLSMLTALLTDRASAPKISEREKTKRQALLQWWIDEALTLLDGPATALVDGGKTSLVGMLTSLRHGLSALSGDRVWTGADGRALSALLEEVESVGGLLNVPVEPRDLVSLLKQLMRDVAVRPPQGGHPRLFIWGLIEGRLQRADRMILAGLNEGQWPQKPSPDPWLPPAIRRRLGLPGLERSSGLAAHDFASALGSPEVIVTRSQREGSAPTVASRLLLRLSALVGDNLGRGDAAQLAKLAVALDSCDGPQPMARPAFMPSADQRPQALSVTEVDTLLADPFAFYARNALGLRRLDPLDAEPTPAWRGTLVHAALEQWLKHPQRSSDSIEPIIASLLAGPGVSAVLRTLWAPRIYPPLQWAAERIVTEQIAGRIPLVEASERRGSTQVGGVSLSGMPDRVDRLADGSLAIVDYKTGSGPNKNAVEQLFALQLGLLGLIAQAGGFTGRSERVSTFEYWRMNKGQTKDRKGQFGWIDTPFKKTKDAAIHADNFVDEARHRFEAAVARWLKGNQPFTAKLEPDFALYADYDQLMRLEEWYGRENASTNDGGIV